MHWQLPVKMQPQCVGQKGRDQDDKQGNYLSSPHKGTCPIELLGYSAKESIEKSVTLLNVARLNSLWCFQDTYPCSIICQMIYIYYETH